MMTNCLWQVGKWLVYDDKLFMAGRQMVGIW